MKQDDGATADTAGRIEPEPLPPIALPLEPRDPPRRVCVVIPAYNEEAVLPRTFEAVRSVLDAGGGEWTVILVNDGSRDGSARTMEQLHRTDPRFGYILLSRNFGHQAALTAGLDHAEGDVIITMDADLQHPPHMIPTLIAAWQAGYDVVHTRKLGTVGLSAWRSVVTRIAYDVVRRAGQVQILPQASDFRLLDRQALTVLRAMPERDRLYRGLTSWIGFRQCAIPYVAEARAAGRSQYGLRQLFGLFSRALLDFSTVPLGTGLTAGAIALALGILATLVAVGFRIAGESSNWLHTPLLLFLALVSAASLTYLGLLGAYVGRIYNHVRGRPNYVIGKLELPRSGRQASVTDASRRSTTAFTAADS